MPNDAVNNHAKIINEACVCIQICGLSPRSTRSALKSTAADDARAESWYRLSMQSKRRRHILSKLAVQKRYLNKLLMRINISAMFTNFRPHLHWNECCRKRVKCKISSWGHKFAVSPRWHMAASIGNYGHRQIKFELLSQRSIVAAPHCP